LTDLPNEISMDDRLKKHSILEVGLSGTFLQLIALKITPLISRYIKEPNYVSFANFLLSFTIFFLLINSFFKTAAFLIFSSLFLDLIDGSLARYLGKTSKKGEVLDSLADLSLWLSIITALFVVTDHPILFYILIAYSFDLYLRLIILSSGLQNDDISNLLLPKSSNLKVVFNHFDSLTILSFILIFDSKMVFIWIIYELLRRVLNMMKRCYKLNKLFF
jgi:phosphatidylglycerophosphate synthase